MTNPGDSDSTFDFSSPEQIFTDNAEDASHGSNLVSTSDGRKVIGIHTSDRGNFKGCRRRWYFSSPLGLGLEPFQRANPLWFGTGIHFALEDFHGHCKYSDPIAAFEDYCRASEKTLGVRMPIDYDELRLLGIAMMDYYANEWLATRDPYETLVIDGVPQVEVTFEIELPIPQEILDRLGIDAIVYRGTIDRVVIHRDLGMISPLDYKTAAAYRQDHLGFDPQITAYMWACSCIYDLPVKDFIYQQHIKTIPKAPRILANGRLSTADSQLTTASRYRKAIIDQYGTVNDAPSKMVDTLNDFIGREFPDRDPFVIRDFADRSMYQIQSEGELILMEVMDMLNPGLLMYPHRGQNCGWCSFKSPCLSIDDGSDWESELADPLSYLPRKTESNSWKAQVKHPLVPVLQKSVAPLKELQIAESLPGII